MSSLNNIRNLRQEIAVQAAKLLAEDGTMDYAAAKQKAMKLCGVSGRVDLPSNEEIEAELKIHLNTFDLSDRAVLLRKKRETALAAMQLLQEFEPMLVGTVLEGTAVENSPIELQLFSDSVKDIAVYLIEKNIPHEPFDRKMRINKNESVDVPTFRVNYGEHEIYLSVLGHKMRRQKLFSPITLQPMNRATTKKLKALLSPS